MNAFLYKIQCVTNLHVGSGDANYSVVDNEVEKDPVLGCPIIHSSGVKGALRDYAEEKFGRDDPRITAWFGSPAASKDAAIPGAIKFMDACLLCRPLRVKGGSSAFIQVTTLDILNHFIRQATAFGCMPNNLKGLREFTDDEKNNPLLEKVQFLSTVNNISVEDENTAFLPADFPQLALLKTLLGKEFAIAKSLDDYPLPVVARNKLENKISKTLWYEEYVPHDSAFFLFALAKNEDALSWLSSKEEASLVQFGGNASVGCGYTKLTRWGGFKNE